MSRSRILAAASLLVVLYCGIDPLKQSPIYGFPEFKSYEVEMPDWSLVPRDKDHENLLQNSEIKFMNQVQGPESLAFDPLGRGPYTGVADGRILFWDGQKWNDFAYTSSNRSGNCDPEDYYPMNEHICGRPLGLRFHKKTGELYIADAYFGLMKVGPEGGLATSLASEAEGIAIGFANDLDIDDEGNVYFTDSSSVYQRRNFMQLVYSGEDSGRVLKYNPSTKETTVLVKNVRFPNGLSLSKDGSFFAFCGGSTGILYRHWLRGDKAGTTDELAILPGYPDNVRANEEGDFWVAIHCRRNIYTYICALCPTLRTFLLKLPIPNKIHCLLQVGFRHHAVVAKYSPEGKLLRILEDGQGKVVQAISQVEERAGLLWMGSVLMPFVCVYKLL